MSSQDLTFEDGLVVAAIRSITKEYEEEVISAANEKDFDHVKTLLRITEDGKFPFSISSLAFRAKLDLNTVVKSVNNLLSLQIIRPWNPDFDPQDLEYFFFYEEKLTAILTAKIEEVLQ